MSWESRVRDEIEAIDPSLIAVCAPIAVAASDLHTLDLDLLAAAAIVDAVKRSTSCGGRFSTFDMRAGAIRALSRTGVAAERNQLDPVILEITTRAAKAVYRLVAEVPPAHVEAFMATETVRAKVRLAGRLDVLARPGRSLLPNELYRFAPNEDISTLDASQCVAAWAIAGTDGLMTVTGGRARVRRGPAPGAAVGHSGAMGSAVRHANAAVELDTVHRFRDPEYAALKLRLRITSDREHAFAVAGELAERGHVERVDHHDAARERMIDAYFQWHARGKRVTLVSGTNAEADAINDAIQQRRVDYGELDPGLVAWGMGEQRIFVGDTVQTRRNDRLTGVENRAQWIVRSIREESVDLVSVGDSGELRRVSTEYAREHLQLAYASTVHGVQGDTADASVVGPDVDAAGLYVSLAAGGTQPGLGGDGERAGCWGAECGAWDGDVRRSIGGRVRGKRAGRLSGRCRIGQQALRDISSPVLMEDRFARRTTLVAGFDRQWRGVSLHH